MVAFGVFVLCKAQFTGKLKQTSGRCIYKHSNTDTGTHTHIHKRTFPNKKAVQLKGTANELTVSARNSRQRKHFQMRLTFTCGTILLTHITHNLQRIPKHTTKTRARICVDRRAKETRSRNTVKERRTQRLKENTPTI